MARTYLGAVVHEDKPNAVLNIEVAAGRQKAAIAEIMSMARLEWPEGNIELLGCARLKKDGTPVSPVPLGGLLIINHDGSHLTLEQGVEDEAKKITPIAKPKTKAKTKAKSYTTSWSTIKRPDEVFTDEVIKGIAEYGACRKYDKDGNSKEVRL